MYVFLKLSLIVPVYVLNPLTYFSFSVYTATFFLWILKFLFSAERSQAAAALLFKRIRPYVNSKLMLEMCFGTVESSTSAHNWLFNYGSILYQINCYDENYQTLYWALSRLFETLFSALFSFMTGLFYNSRQVFFVLLLRTTNCFSAQIEPNISQNL